MITLSSKQAREILSGFPRGEKVPVSLDLGRTQSHVGFKENSAVFPDGQFGDIKYLKKIASDNGNIFLIEDCEVMKAMLFSDETNKLYKLRPTATWPALEISGVLMHRIRGTDPKKDAEDRIASISPLGERFLETCCGLGYSATLAAKQAEKVVVVEKDENVLELAKVNPFSQELFSNKKIKLIRGDVTEEIRKFKENSFDAIIHDPPSVSIAGELYSDEFYGQLFRVLKPKGTLLHYTGLPGSRHRGVDLPSSVAKRLAGIGFSKVREDKKTLCVIAAK